MKTEKIDEYDSWDGDKIPTPDASRFELKSERKYVSLIVYKSFWINSHRPNNLQTKRKDESWERCM